MRSILCSLALGCVLIAISCSTSYSEGQRLYELHCQSCHMENGQGLKQLYPPLMNADYARENFDFMACIIRYGLEDTIKVNGRAFNEKMAGIPSLNEVEVANIMNYVNKEYLQLKGRFVSPRDVTAQWKQCELMK